MDFNYEVSRSLAACDGAVLVVDATQGVEAQTVANAMMAMNANLEIIPLINKIDLPAAEPERVKAEIEDGLAIPADDAVLASGKTGEGVHDLLEAVVYNIPAPEGDGAAPLRALIFDSVYDSYRGVIVYVRVMDGTVRPGMTIRMMATGATADVVEVVRCGQCFYSTHEGELWICVHPDQYCDCGAKIVNPGYFCGYGRRCADNVETD